MLTTLPSVKFEDLCVEYKNIRISSLHLQLSSSQRHCYPHHDIAYHLQPTDHQHEVEALTTRLSRIIQSRLLLPPPPLPSEELVSPHSWQESLMTLPWSTASAPTCRSSPPRPPTSPWSPSVSPRPGSSPSPSLCGGADCRRCSIERGRK